MNREQRRHPEKQPVQQEQKMPLPLRVLIGIPSRDEFEAETSLSLAYLMHHITANPVVMMDGMAHFIVWEINNIRTSLLPQSRQNLVDKAIRDDADFLLMFDSDMVFDPTFLTDWLVENRPVMAMNCPTRSIPCHATARDFDPAEPHKGSVVYSDTAPERFQRVWRVGTGVMLLRADALRSVPRPAFTPRWEPGNDAYVGEDWVLCEHLQAAGIPILVDHEQSLAIKHIGNVKYTHEMAAGTRKAIERQKRITQSGIIVPDTKVPE